MSNTLDLINNARFQGREAIERQMTGSFRKKAEEAGNRKSFQNTLDDSINTMRGADKKRVDTKLRDVCIEMESIFVAKMLKEMRQTVHKNEWLHGGFAEEIFEDMLYDEYARDVSKNSDLGLAAMLYRELSGKM